MQSKKRKLEKMHISAEYCKSYKYTTYQPIKARKLTPIEKRSKKQVSCKRRKVAIGFNFVSNGVKMVQVVWIDLQAKQRKTK